MSIITYIDFTGEQQVPGISNAGTREVLQLLIDEYEPIFLAELLGDDLAIEFKAGLVLVPIEPATDPVTYEPIDAKWLALRDDMKLKYMLVRYVYYWYLRNNVSLTIASGEGKATKENAVPISSVNKQCKNWNDMSRAARLFTLDLAIYYSYRKCKHDSIFHPISDRL